MKSPMSSIRLSLVGMAVCCVLVSPWQQTVASQTMQDAKSPRPMEISDILAQAAFSDIEMSDDGSWILYHVRRPNLTTDKNDTAAFVIRKPLTSPTRVADELPGARWRPGTNQISYLNAERNKIVLADVSDNGLKTTASIDLDQSAPTTSFEWNADGTLIAALSSYRSDTRAAGAPYRLDPISNVALYGRGVVETKTRLSVSSVDGTRICVKDQEGDFTRYSVAWSPAGRTLVAEGFDFLHARGAYGMRVQVVRVGERSCEITHIVPDISSAMLTDDHTLYGAAHPPLVSDTGTIRLTAPRNVLQRLDLGGGGAVTVTSVHEGSAVLAGDSAPSIEQMAQSDGTLFAWVQSRARTSLFRLASEALVPAADPQWHLSGCSVARTVRMAACVAETSTTPPELAVVELRSGVVTRVTHENDHFKNIALGKVEPVFVNDALGRPVTMYAVYPVNYTPTKKYPAIIVMYGFRGQFVSQAQYITSYAPQVYAARGYVTLLWNYPGFLSAKIGDPKDLTLMFQENQLAAIVAGRNWLIEKGSADSAKIGIAGHSMGSIWADYAIAQGVDFAAAASHAPGTFFTSNYWTGAGWARTRLRHLFGGNPNSPNTSWDRLSPSRMPPPRIPQLREVPERDMLPEVEFRHWMDVGAPVEFWSYPGEGHVFSTPKGRRASLELNLDWFEFWLSGREDPSPDKKEQYERWRRLVRQSPKQ